MTRLIAILLGLGVAGLGHAGCKAREGGDCTASSDCGDGLRCDDDDTCQRPETILQRQRRRAEATAEEEAEKERQRLQRELDDMSERIEGPVRRRGKQKPKSTAPCASGDPLCSDF